MNNIRKTRWPGMAPNATAQRRVHAGAQELSSKGKSRRSFILGIPAGLMFLAGWPSVAKADCDLGTFEKPIFTAGQGESLIAGLPTPLPYPIRRAKDTFKEIAHGILTVRSLAFEGNIQGAIGKQETLINQALHVVSYLSDRIAGLPTPLPEPIEGILPDLVQIASDLGNQIATLPVPIP